MSDMEAIKAALIREANVANRCRDAGGLDELARGMRVAVVAVARDLDPDFLDWLPKWH